MGSRIIPQFILLVVVALHYSNALHAQHCDLFWDFYGNCPGPYFRTNETVEDLSGIVNITAVTSTIIKGLWRHRTSTECRTSVSLIVEYEYACSGWPMISDEKVSLTKLMPTDFEESAILFWDQTVGCWTNSDHIVVTGTEKSFAEPLSFTAIAFTGAESYTIYSGTNFTGEAECLQPSANTDYHGYGMNYKDGRFVVGSVRLGCDATAVKKSVRAEHEAGQVVVVSKKPVSA